jgi:Fe-S cluster biosynthesis and repair protein YggX
MSTAGAPQSVDRIAQFEKMASADPTHEMAHFSLGKAYLDASRHAEAARSFERCVELAPDMSKAYQLGGQAMIGAAWTDRAVEFMNRGYETAARKGDLMPKNAIGELLRSIGREPPKLGAEVDAAAERLKASGSFICQRTGRPGNKLPSPPFKGVIGQWIFENISAETWKQWIGQGTKVINELRLDFSRDKDQETYDQHMREFLGIDAEVLERIGAK